MASQGLYPAIEPLQSRSKMLSPGITGEKHYNTARNVRQTLADYDELKPYLTTPAQQTALGNFVSLWKKLPTMRSNTVAP